MRALTPRTPERIEKAKLVIERLRAARAEALVIRDAFQEAADEKDREAIRLDQQIRASETYLSAIVDPPTDGTFGPK